MDSSNNFYNYIHNILKNDAFIKSGNNIIFEFVPAQATSTFNTTPIIQNTGFPDVSAIGVIPIQAKLLNNLFYFQTDSNGPGPTMNIIHYGINSNYHFNLNYSNTEITYGIVNSSLKIDFVSYLAYYYTSATNINVFTNANQLLQSVVHLDASFNNTINSNLTNSIINNNYYNNGTDNILLISNSTNPFYNSTKQLIDGMMYLASDSRKQIFMNDLASQDGSNNVYSFQFHSGDVMSVLIKFITSFGVRSYKIALLCGSNFEFPPSVSSVGYNPNGNLDPFYVLQLLNLTTFNNFTTIFNNSAPTIIPNIYKEIGTVVSPLDFYFKTFMSNITQPSIIDNSLINNGVNPSFQYIFLNSTITTILYPSLNTIKTSLITSPYNQYPTLNDIQDIQCDLNSYNGDHFFIRIYTRPAYSTMNDNLSDSFYSNYYDSSISGTFDYTTFHLNDLFSNWPILLDTSYNQTVYYNGPSGLQPTTITRLGQEQILSICIYTKNVNANIDIKNIIITYK